LLNLKTLAKIALSVLVLFTWVPAASAWSWPVQGPVLQPFAYDEEHPYDAGQHRGMDIGADAAGEEVVAPAAGTIAFAGTVPTSGKAVTIETPDGYAVTLTHLGSLLVAKGGTVAEGDPVGTVGPSGAPEVAGPYVHLGIRVAADPNGYVDPLDLLPAPTAEDPPTDSGSTSSQPSTSGGSAVAPASASTPAAPASAPPARETERPSRSSGGRVSRRRAGRAPASGAKVQRARPVQRPAVQPAAAASGVRVRTAKPHRSASPPAYALRRGVVEVAAPAEPTGLGAGHELRPSVSDAQPPRRRRPRTDPVALPLVCNGAAALVALAAAFAAASGRRRRRDGRSSANAPVLELPRRVFEHRRAA
jgi:Peptidase family M23